MRSINRTGLVSGTGLIVTGLTATLVALAIPIWSYEDRSGTGLDTLNAQSVSTQFGPLSALDREFITKVRLAGLWELPAGQQAQERGTTEAVRTAGAHLIEGHTFLDARVRNVAARLGLELPNQPSEQQRAWLTTLDGAQGVDYDREFANILRKAHGKVFSSSPRSARTPATPSCATSPTTRTPPCSTTSRSWKPPDTSTSTPSPRTRPPPPRPRSPTPRPCPRPPGPLSRRFR